MKKRLLLFLITVCLFTVGVAQKTLKGKLTDSQTNTPIRGASVSIKNPADPAFSRYAISDAAGGFLFSAA